MYAALNSYVDGLQCPVYFQADTLSASTQYLYQHRCVLNPFVLFNKSNV